MTERSESRADPDAAVTGRGIDIATGFVLVGLALFALVWLIPNHTQPPDSLFDVAPGFFPTVAAGVGVGSFAGHDIGHPLVRVQAESEYGLRILSELVAWAATAVIGLMLLLVYATFLPMAALLLVAGMLFSGNRSPWLIVAMAVAFPLAVDLSRRHG